jgi:hypothetical protein
MEMTGCQGDTAAEGGKVAAAQQFTAAYASRPVLVVLLF